MTRDNEPIWEWCRANLKGFAELEKWKNERDALKREQAVRFAGCPKVVPKDERRVA